MKDLPELHEQKVNGFALSVKRALLGELRRGLMGNLPADMLSRRLDQVFKANALLLEKAMFMYCFEADGDKSTCSVCSQHDGRIGTAEEFERLEALPPLHPNCRCKLEPLAEGPHRGYTESEISYAERLGISEDALEELKKSASLEDLLFVDNIVYQYGKFFDDVPSVEKILSALYIVKNNDEKAARKLLREAGFTETFVLWTDYGEIGHILLAYEAAKMGENLPLLDANYEKQRQAEVTMLLAMMSASLVDRLLTGPAFNPATGCSAKSALDQLEKNGYLTPAQQQVINATVGQGSGIAGSSIPKYPGNDPNIPPGRGFEWRGKGAPASGKGNWYNPTTGEKLNPDLSHSAPLGPHWDYTDSRGNSFRLFPDGRIVPK